MLYLANRRVKVIEGYKWVCKQFENHETTWSNSPLFSLQELGIERSLKHPGLSRIAVMHTLELFARSMIERMGLATGKQSCSKGLSTKINYWVDALDTSMYSSL